MVDPLNAHFALSLVAFAAMTRVGERQARRAKPDCHAGESQNGQVGESRSARACVQHLDTPLLSHPTVRDWFRPPKAGKWPRTSPYAEQSSCQHSMSVKTGLAEVREPLGSCSEEALLARNTRYKPAATSPRAPCGAGRSAHAITLRYVQAAMSALEQGNLGLGVSQLLHQLIALEMHQVEPTP